MPPTRGAARAAAIGPGPPHGVATLCRADYGPGHPRVNAGQIDAVVAEIDRQLPAEGRRVHLIVNYDNFSLAPNLRDAYLAAVAMLSDKYYASVTRYSTSAFLRLKLGDTLADRGVAPHIYESLQEAVSWARGR
jgi:propionate CoA-transferase